MGVGSGVQRGRLGYKGGFNTSANYGRKFSKPNGGDMLEIDFNLN